MPLVLTTCAVCHCFFFLLLPPLTHRSHVLTLPACPSSCTYRLALITLPDAAQEPSATTTITTASTTANTTADTSVNTAADTTADVSAATTAETTALPESRVRLGVELALWADPATGTALPPAAAAATPGALPAVATALREAGRTAAVDELTASPDADDTAESIAAQLASEVAWLGRVLLPKFAAMTDRGPYVSALSRWRPPVGAEPVPMHTFAARYQTLKDKYAAEIVQVRNLQHLVETESVVAVVAYNTGWKRNGGELWWKCVRAALGGE